MSQGTISHYSSRNLDACTLQLKRWRPFVSPSTPEGVVDLHQPARCAEIDPPILPTPRPLDIKTGVLNATGSPALHLVKCSFKQMMNKSISGGERFRWACHPFKEAVSDADNHGPNLCDSMEFLCHHSDSVGMSVEGGLPAENNGMMLNRGQSSMPTEEKEDYQNVDTNMRCCFEEMPGRHSLDQVKSSKDIDIVAGLPPTLGIYRVTGYLTEQAALVKPHGALNARDTANMSMLAPSVSGWSKRHKQLSRALARGLWRWKENSQARKRRRKCGSSRSGSGRSSESRRARFNGSDAPTMGASAAYATCSDFPMPGTDSSGELFFYGDSGGINWDSQVSLSGEGLVQRIDGVDVLHAWIVSESQSLESGYGSEPGYRGDGELGYGDDGVPDEQDEEEREQLRLGPWSDNSAKKPPSVCGITMTIPEDEDAMAESKMQHRLRRRRQESKPPVGHKSRHFI
ncbi:hypothetical protein GOP47_0024269 [Adiantum capillus-veneris]|uniref:Uncharacterized protein n=1 Tax=Adiantum capillus-veneris TaxID=13818 RepID=A0A9D4Z578_ADICA|nr:hypothetical protein GOP47_0024269 [Adiantum capillus-veneris]